MSIYYLNKPLSGYSQQELLDGLTPAQKNLIFPRQALKTFRTTSGAANDDGDLELGLGGTPIALLPNGLLNAFGNNFRFTTDTGIAAPVSGGIYVIDHLTGNGWFTTLNRPAMAWAAAVADAAAFTIGAYTGFHLPNFNELWTIVRLEGPANVFTYNGGGAADVFANNAGPYWTSTEFDATNARAITELGVASIPLKVAVGFVACVRRHYS